MFGIDSLGFRLIDPGTFEPVAYDFYEIFFYDEEREPLVERNTRGENISAIILRIRLIINSIGFGFIQVSILMVARVLKLIYFIHLNVCDIISPCY